MDTFFDSPARADWRAMRAGDGNRVSGSGSAAERVDEDEEVGAAARRLIRAGRLPAADALLAKALAREPDSEELLYLLAVCQRRSHRLEAALATLARLKEIAPDHGRAHQEEGHSCRRLGRTADALRAYRTACRCNPALIASWRAREEILRAGGRSGEAATARARVDYLDRLPPPLVAVLDLIHQNRLLKAERICREFLKRVPHHVEAMRLLADIGVRFGVLDDAEFLLESAVEFAPDDPRVRIDYINTLRKRQRFDAALAQAEKLLAAEPDEVRFRSLAAVTCMQAGDCARALSLFDEVLARVPGDPATLTAKGHALKTVGEYEAAVASYRAALAAGPRYGEACYALANLKTYRFGDDEIAAMTALEASADLPRADRVYVCFALGKAHEDGGRYAESFRCYRRGNALKKASSRYRAEANAAETRAIREACGRELFAARAGAGCPDPDPIFIVGLPRAGSTLLEQILASHSRVDGTRELPDMLSLAHRLRRDALAAGEKGYAARLARLTPAQLREYGAAYLRDTRAHRQGAPFFVDKMPNNFFHVGLIKLILPNAKIIDARREPMACCFGAYKQLFAEGQEFSYDLADLGSYYRDYVELMNHWNEVLPGAVLPVRHEDVVANLETEVRRMLTYCGLPFEPRCLEFHRTQRSVRTPSSEQVRQPIYTDSLAQWRNYEAFLGPLREVVEPLQ